ncbi:uncharacterized protein F4807DRAFT_439306 [Annulohypoxylon truncatum]|uniref:uncharacterized protein n=1 Tax=Annulohypoxylon truncatum TaxID=327061 RepID=UPI00200738B4|nr:uncharacterized protein F4807DRAFT_439306 [Annulohypoxylon truncatum]KAI1206470.1 hypothetical protein F4807DRAFT_439306 [Annulohypoxylon truncatum]
MSFSDLPFELRIMIWELVLPDKKQEICIPWPLQEEAPPDAFIRPPRSPRKFLEPFLVDTDFPVLMHVCRESRGFAIARTRFRHSLVAGCPVPFRAFDPDLDIMYYSRCRPPIGPDDYKWGDFPRALKHLAVDVHTLRDGSYFAEAFCQHFHLRTITCILPAPGAIVLTSARFRPPYRRCRLRAVEQPTTSGSQSHFIHVDSGNYRRLCSISRFLEEVRDHIDDGFLSYIRDDGLMHPNFRPRWNAEEQKYDFELDAAMFEEYRGGSWDLSSKHRVRFDAQYVRFPDERVAIQRVKSYKVSEEEKWTPLRNPETFRVNDIQQDEVEFETESSEDIHMGMSKLAV